MNRILTFSFILLAGVSFISTTLGQEADRTVTIQSLDVSDNLYLISGGGGHTVMLITEKHGVVLVDTKNPGWGSSITNAVKAVTEEPITTIINTHAHNDHVGSNAHFPNITRIISHENARDSIAKSPGVQGNGHFLPTETFQDKLAIFDGRDQIDLYYFGRGHTDGDTFVVFRTARTVHTGDMFARKGLPFLDVANGNGSALEFGETLRKAVDGIDNVDTVIPGHNDEVLRWSDLASYSDFYNDLVATIQASQAAGQSVDDVVEAYVLPSRHSGFQVTEDRLRSVAQHVFDGQ